MSVYFPDGVLRAGQRAQVDIENGSEAPIAAVSVTVDGETILNRSELIDSASASFTARPPEVNVEAAWVEQVEQADGTVAACAGSDAATIEVVEIPRVRGTWSFRFAPANPSSPPIRTTWRLSQACATGACSFTARPVGTRNRLWFKRGNGRYTWRDTVRTDATCDIIYRPTGEVIETYRYRGDWDVQVRIRSSGLGPDGRLNALGMRGSGSLFLYVPDGTWSSLCDSITLRWRILAGRKRITSRRASHTVPSITRQRSSGQVTAVIRVRSSAPGSR